MSVMVLLELSISDGRLDEAACWLRSAVMDARAHQGCIMLDAYQSRDDPSTIVFVEHFESRAAHEAYVGWRRDRGDFDHLTTLMDGDPAIRYFDLVDL